MTSTHIHQQRLIAEWEPQSGIMLAWPHENSDWRSHLDAIEKVFVKLVAAISAYEKVLIIGQNPDHIQHIRARLGADMNVQHVVFSEVSTNDTWCRDYGPLSVDTGEGTQLLDFGFDGWNRKFSAELDNQVNRQLADRHRFKVPLTSLPVVLEGGSIDTNGNGLLLTTAECLLQNNRNPHMTKQDFEQLFAREFHCHTTLWLEHGYIAGDDTDGHIDMLARFTDSRTIVYCQCTRADDEHYEALQAMEKELQTFTRQVDGLKIVPIPLPSAVLDTDGERLPASYANFLILDRAVLLPVYNVIEDQQAQQVLSGLFPDRAIIPIDCTPVITQSGSLHCLTMQLPLGVI